MVEMLFLLTIVSLPVVKGTSYTGSYIVSADSQLTFADAESFCKINYGSNLATITTESDNTAVQQACTDAGIDSETIWIGLTDLASEGSWSWTDATTVTYVNWKIAEPLGGVLENCVVMNLAENTYEGQWSDVSCSDLSFFVCNQIATSSPAQAPITTSDSLDLSSTSTSPTSSSIQVSMNASSDSIASTSAVANDNDVSVDAECKCDDDENDSELSTVVVITIAWALIVLSCSFVHIVMCIKEKSRTAIDDVQTLHPVHSLHPVERLQNIQKSATLTETNHENIMHVHADTARKSDLMKYNVRHESKILPVVGARKGRNSRDTYISKDYPSNNTVFVNEFARVQFARTSKISEDSVETAGMGANEDDEDDAGEHTDKGGNSRSIMSTAGSESMYAMPRPRMDTSSKQRVSE